MIPLQDQPAQCAYCGQKFRLERTVISHMCEKKRRHLQRTERRVQTGFMVFNKFFQVSSNTNKQRTYEEFCDSPFYNSFVKFGGYVNNIDAIHPEMFMDYVVRSGAKLDNWCKDELYFKYIADMVKKEPVDSALQRSIMTMMDWADNNSQPYNVYFQKASGERLVHDVVNGKLSPWVILNSKSGRRALGSLNESQLMQVTPMFDGTFWKRRFADRAEDVELVISVCSDAGIE